MPYLMSKDGPNGSSPSGNTGSSVETDPTLPGLASAPAPKPTSQVLPEVELNRYEIAGEFAQGAVGRILRARDRRLGRPVAIKELLSPSSDLQARFVAEAFITARLQHPSIVPVYEAGRWPTGEPFYAMKLVSGRSLASVIAEKKTLQERLELLPHVLAVAEAIAYAHTERIIHRDLKPANVLVGAFGETIVIDWGLAKDLAQQGSEAASPPERPRPVDASLTYQGSVVGTPAYMPPEQAAGRPVDERADVYALGAILYHLLAGSKPYDKGSSDQVLAQVVQGPPIPLSQLQAGIPTDLLAIVAKAMARDPAERYATARELAEDLRRFQTGQIVAAHVYSVGERFWRFIRRYRAAVAVSVVALLILIGLGTLGLRRVLAERDRAERKQAEAEVAQHAAESAQLQALERADELTLLHARAAVERDPNEAIAWLRTLSPGFKRWTAVRTIAADARARGFATILRGHTQTVGDVAFTPDGKRLISCSDDYTVRVWDLENGKARILTGHTDEVWRLELSPDGRHVATASKDRTARLWTLDTGESRVLSGHGGPVDGVGFTADGRRLVTSSRGDGLLRVWDVGSGSLLQSLETGMGALGNLALSRDGRQVIVDGFHVQRAQLWDLEKGTSLTLEHRGRLTGLTFSPRGDLVATGARDQTVRVWDTKTGQGRVLAEQFGVPAALAFSQDGRRLAAGNADGHLRLWELDTGQSKSLKGHEGRVNYAQFSPDGRYLASSSDDRTARLWDLTTELHVALRGHQGAAHPITFSPDGRRLAVGGYDGTTRIFPVVTEARRVLWKAPGLLKALVASPTGQHLAVLEEQGSLHLLDASTGGVRLLEEAGGLAPSTLAFSPDGGWLAASTNGGQVRVWATTTGQIAHRLEGHAGALAALAFSPDGRSIATADARSEIRIWELTRGKPRSLGRMEHAIVQLAFSPDGRRIVSGGKRGEVRLWELADGKFRELRGHEEEIRGLIFSSDGQRLISGSLDHTLRIWDLSTGESLRADASGNGVQEVLASPDEGMLISTSVKDSSLRLWNGRTGQSLGVLQGHQGDITDIALSPDGQRLVSASADRTVRLWDLPTRESRVLHGHDARVIAAVFLDNQNFASIGEDKAVRLWPDDLPKDPKALRSWLDSVASPSP
jgi:WD40 repeat protein